MTPVIDRWRQYTPKQRQAIADASPALLKRAHRRMVKERATIDFWFFLRYVIRNPVLYAPLHRRIAKWLEPQNWTKLKKMLLIPRGHIKSNLVTVGWVTWEIIRDPNIRVLLASHKESDGTKFLNAIQKIILSERFQAIFPEIRPALRAGSATIKKRWSDKAMLIQRQGDAVDNTVEVSSFETEMTGRHYDLFVPDDIVTRQSVQQPEIIKKTRENHQLCQSLLDPGGREVMVGTRYDWSDEYGSIIDDEDMAKEYDIITARALPDISFITNIRSGRHKWTEADDNVLLYPTRFTLAPQDYVDPDDPTKNKKSLTSLYTTQGAWTFSCQYMNDPVDPATATFKRSAIEGMWVDNLPEGPLQYFRVCDLSSERPTDAFTAIVTGAMDARANVYITDIFWGTYSPLATIDELIQGQGGPCPACLNDKENKRCQWHQVPADEIPRAVGFERGPYEKQIRPFLERAMQDRKTFVPITWLSTAQGGKSKDERIRGLQPWLEGGKFFVLKTCRNRGILEEELIKFPKFSRKDVVDCCAMIEHIMFPAGAKAELEEQAQEDKDAPDWFKKLQLQKGGRYIGERNVMPQSVSIKVGMRSGIN